VGFGRFINFGRRDYPVNVYDCAYELARALKESEEYKKLLEARARVDADPKNKQMFLDFRKCQWEIQKAKALGKDVDENQLRRFEQLADLVNLNPVVKELIAAEFRFSRLMADIQKILVSTLSEWSQMAGEVLGGDE
jgi:cell fate (sporulation/competence/biofilm development) regulator YlbF (YheA/YmcA/DUF963 family)